MPQIPLIFGQMDLDSDQSAKKDGVLAHLYNGYRVGDAIHMWPRLQEYCDLGTGEDVWTWYSSLHNIHLAVSAGKLFKVVDGVGVEIAETELTAGVPPTFKEDAHRIFIAAKSPINFFTPTDDRVYIPRTTKLDPVISATTTISTAKPDLDFLYYGFKKAGSDEYYIRYQTYSATGKHYRLDLVINGDVVTKVADEAPGEYVTDMRTITTGTYNVRLRLVDINTENTLVESGEMSVTIMPGNGTPLFVQLDGSGTEPDITITNITQSSVTFNYGTKDSETDKYDLFVSLDAGKTYSKVKDTEPPAGNLEVKLEGLQPNTRYRALLSLVAVNGCKAQVVSPLLVFDTLASHPVSADNNDPDSPLVITAQPSPSAVTTTSATINYGTADPDNNTYKVEYSLNGGVTWVEAVAEDKAGTGKTINVDGLTPDTTYLVVMRLTSIPSSPPLNVTSLAFIAGFLVANGDDPNGGGLPGDFAYSDTQFEDGIATYTQWSYENNASKPDALQTIIATPDDGLFAIGTNSVDVSYLSGSVDNPFAANKGANQPFGTPSRDSIAYDDESIYFLAVIAGSRNIVKLVGGREPEIIGFPIGVPIQQMEKVDDARAFLMAYKGHPFYVITFPNANVHIDDSHHDSISLAYNIRMKEWSIIGDWNGLAYSKYLANSFVYDGTTTHIGSVDGKICTLAEEDRTTEPVMLHRWRDNGNLEWKNARAISLGESGVRRTPPKQRQCGRYYKRQDEFTFSNGKTRMTIRTGWRNWGKNSEKISNQYVYDVKRGDSPIVFLGVEEEITVLP